MDNFWKISMITLLVALLLSVRAFEADLFYDPFLAYFKNDYLEGPLPKFDFGDLFFGLFFRYSVNTILSLGIIYVLFEDSQLLRFTSALYIALFFILVALFLGLLYLGSTNNFFLFYTRRFLIQPLFLILFVPAFYYQRQAAKK